MGTTLVLKDGGSGRPTGDSLDKKDIQIGGFSDREKILHSRIK